MTTAGEPGTVKSDELLFEVLDVLSDRGRVGVTAIADEIGASKGAVHKHLKTLQTHEYVVNEGGEYRLGHKFVKYGSSVLDYRLCNHARPKVTDLAEETGEMVVFVVKEGDHGAYVYTSAITENRGDVLTWGWRFPLYGVSMGRVMLAELPDAEVRALLDRLGVTEDLDVEGLLADLDDIRRRGYDADDAVPDGIKAVSAPVVDPKSDTVGAIAIVGPPRLLTDETIEQEYADALTEATDRINFDLRY